jgi:hypothetical protein
MARRLERRLMWSCRREVGNETPPAATVVTVAWERALTLTAAATKARGAAVQAVTKMSIGCAH